MRKVYKKCEPQQGMILMGRLWCGGRWSGNHSRVWLEVAKRASHARFGPAHQKQARLGWPAISKRAENCNPSRLQVSWRAGELAHLFFFFYFF